MIFILIILGNIDIRFDKVIGILLMLVQFIENKLNHFFGGRNVLL